MNRQNVKRCNHDRPWEPRPRAEPYQLAVGEMNVAGLPERIQIAESAPAENASHAERH